MDVFIDYYFLSEDFRMIVNLDMQYDIIDNFSDLGPNSIQGLHTHMKILKCGMMQLSK